MLTAVQSLYEGVECAVRVNGSLSEWFSVSNGLKQGCNLSPTLFSLYLNDLAVEIKSLGCGVKYGEKELSILLFADDIALLSDSEEKMQQMLTCLNNWCKKWRLSLNMGKTKMVHYRHESSSQSDFEFKIGTENISWINGYKYLGLWLEQHLDMKETVKFLAASANRALGALCTKFHKIGGMSHTMFTHLYESLVMPVLNYGAGIWGTASYSKVNTIQNRACRFFLGVGSSTSNAATRGDMGWSSQLEKQYTEVLRLYHRGESVNHTRAIGMVHAYCKTVKFRSLWINKVANICRKIGYDYLDTNMSSKMYVHRFKVFFAKYDQEQWYNSLFNDAGHVNGNKLRLYRMHKERLEPETYVTCSNISRYNKSVIAKLRCGSLPLQVEIGRYHKVPLEDRICSLCQSVVEDEVHFLVDCKFYADLRYNMFNVMEKDFTGFYSMPSLVKYNMLMNSEHVMLLSNLLSNMFNRRKCFIS